MKSNGMRLILYQLRIQKGYLRVWLGYMTGAVLIMNEAMASVCKGYGTGNTDLRTIYGCSK